MPISLAMSDMDRQERGEQMQYTALTAAVARVNWLSCRRASGLRGITKMLGRPDYGFVDIQRNGIERRHQRIDLGRPRRPRPAINAAQAST